MILASVITGLMNSPLDANQELSGGLWLCWRPVDVLIITRPETPPDGRELEIVLDHLSKMGYQGKPGKMNNRMDKKGFVWYYWRIKLYKQLQLV